MKFIQKVSEKIGLTQTEIKVISFLAFIFLVGSAIKLTGWKNDESSKSSYDYSAEDSIFFAANYADIEKNANKKFDSNLESSDFNKSNLKLTPEKSLLKEKSINLNKANLEQLTLLPGIGIKTAEKILAYRKTNGAFKKVDQLLDIQGIGNSKLDKIKKYLYIQ